MYFISFNKLIGRKLCALSTLSTLIMYVLYLFNVLTIGLLLGISNAYAETQFLDEFDTVNQSIWAYPTGAASFNGRTQMRPNFPDVSNGLLHLQLDTFNPTGNSFYGSEIFTLGKAAPGTGLSAEFKARLVTPVKGLVGGAFLYDIFSTGFHSEIDFELLSNYRDKVQTNIYANEPLGAGSPEFNTTPQLDITQFNTYRIEWLPNKVRWFVNNVLIRENTSTVPQEQLRLFLNFYAPHCDWANACDANLQPASRPEDNKTYFFDIDWVRVVFGLNPETECLFSWTEQNYAHLFAPANSATKVWSVYTFRYYENTDSYVGVSSTNNHVYYMGPDRVLQDVDTLSYWLPIAGCQATTSPSIEFTSVPAYGSFNDLKGRVLNADPASYRVAVYIKVGSGWWTKPSFAAPLTAIASNGTWTTDITTGGSDQNATEIAAFLVPASYSPPQMQGGTTLPSTLNAYPNVSVTRNP